jgi:hexulose-6-phosphate isomerase
MEIKRGLFQGCFPASVSMQDCLEITASLGFDGLELTTEDPEPLLPAAIGEATAEVVEIGRSVGMTVERPGAVTLRSTDEHVTSVGAAARAAGIHLHSVATMMLFFYPLSSPMSVIRDRGIDTVLRMLEIASLVGADTVLIVPGIVTPMVGYRDVYRRSQEVIRDLASEAARREVILAVENVWNYFLLSPLEMARYLDEIGSDYVAAYVDVANLLPYGYPQDWLRILGPRVRGLHFKDFRKDIRNLQAFVHLLHGDVDWHAVRQALQEIAYGGYVTVEVPPLKSHPLKALGDVMSSLNAILATDAQ